MCSCIATANKFLRDHNGRVKEHMGFTGKMKLTSMLAVQTEKIDPKKRKGPPLLVASFCPMCGEKFPERESVSK